MAYDVKDLEERALKAIAKHKLIFIDEVANYIGCSVSTYYNHKMQEMESIKDALLANKVSKKVSLRKKWLDSENAALNIALYRLCSTEEEHRKLNPATKEDTNTHNHNGDVHITFSNTDELPTTEQDIEDFTNE